MPGRHGGAADRAGTRTGWTRRMLSMGAIAAGILLPASGRAQQILSGIVTEDATRRPLAGVDVMIRAVVDSAGSSPLTRTDSSGRFRLGIPETGRFRIEVRKPGFEVLVTPLLDGDLADAGRIELVLRPAQSGVAALIRGRIVDSTGIPIGFAQVRVGPSGEQVTDELGRFDVAVRIAGRVPITVRRIGYRPLEVALPALPDSALRLVMAPLAGTLQTVHIDADRTVASLERTGFYDRLRERARAANTGHFITPEEIDRRRPIRASALLEGISGIKVLPISSKRYALYGTNGCALAVYLNGVRVSGIAEKVATDIDELIAPTELAGVEVYARANVPPQYQMTNGTCGVLLLWGK